MLETQPDLDRWRRRAQTVEEPESGSDLALDDKIFPHMAISQLARMSLVLSGEHLRFALDAVHAKQLYPSSHLPVLRGALVGASQGVWILRPDDRRGTSRARSYRPRRDVQPVGQVLRLPRWAISGRPGEARQRRAVVRPDSLHQSSESCFRVNLDEQCVGCQREARFGQLPAAVAQAVGGVTKGRSPHRPGRNHGRCGPARHASRDAFLPSQAIASPPLTRTAPNPRLAPGGAMPRIARTPRHLSLKCATHAPETHLTPARLRNEKSRGYAATRSLVSSTLGHCSRFPGLWLSGAGSVMSLGFGASDFSP